MHPSRHRSFVSLAVLIAVAALALPAPAQNIVRCILHSDSLSSRADSCTVTRPAPQPPPPAPAPAPPPPPPPPVTTDTVIASVKVAPNPVTLASGKSFQLTGGAYNKSGQKVVGAGLWFSGNPAVVKVDQTGLITGVGPGTTNVEFRYSTKTAWSTVTDTGAAPTPAPTSSTSVVPADSFAKSVGVGTHFSYFDLSPYSPGANVTRTVGQIKALGVAFIRDGATVNTSASWMNTYWGPVKQVVANGAKVLFVTQPQVQGNWTSTAAIDTAVARLGAAAFLGFEGPNEVDNNNTWWGGIPAYGPNVKTFQCAAYARVKTLAPAAKMTSPTVTSGTGASYMSDLSACSDAAAIHPYPGGKLPTSSLASTMAFTATYAKGKPFWVTETGYHTNLNGTVNHYQPGVSELAAAKYVTREYLDYFLAGVPRSATYEFVDEWNDANNDEANFGLVRNDGTLKPAYTSLQRLLTAVADPGPAFTPAAFSFTLSGTTSTTRALALGKRTGAVLFVLWNDVLSYDVTAKQDLNPPAVSASITLAKLPSKVTALYVVGGTGTATTVTPSTKLVVSVVDAPVVVEVTP